MRQEWHIAVSPLFTKWNRCLSVGSLRVRLICLLTLLPNGPRGLRWNNLYRCSLNAAIMCLTGTVIDNVRHVAAGVV